MTIVHVGSLSKIRVPIVGRVGGAQVVPTGFVVELAVLPQGTAVQNSDWKTGAWETDNTGPETIYFGTLMIGPGAASGIVLTSGIKYRAFGRVTVSGSEKPIVDAVNLLEAV